MKDGPDIARLAALIGDPARANMLTALMSGQALTGRELAEAAGVTPQTASGHLAQLEAAGLVARRRQGRHRYAALAGPEVGAALEALMGLAAAAGHSRARPGPKDPALRAARICYDHLAGEMGVRLYDGLLAQGALAEDGGGAPSLTPEGAARMRAFGVDPAPLARARRPLCRACLDWSSRRNHLAGALGAAL
ncbi:MAG: winged helix-turn-helix domain-containing protein, partial [Pseudomonadota bacterium]